MFVIFNCFCVWFLFDILFLVLTLFVGHVCFGELAIVGTFLSQGISRD